MQEKIILLIKIGAIGLVALLLLIPLAMIESLVDERSFYRSEAMDAVALSWSKSQTLIGPILVIPYEEKTTIQEWNEKLRIEKTKIQTHQKYLYLPPEKLTVTSEINTEERYKGIYAFPVYRTSTQLTGNYRIQGIQALAEKENIKLNQAPYVVMGISDPRGISATPTMQWDTHPVTFESGCPGNTLKSGIHAILPPLTPESENKLIAFQLNLKLQGMEHFKVTPIGRNVTVDYNSNWPHPSFTGPYPTTESHISNDEFTSSWEISHSVTNLGKSFESAPTQYFQNLSHKAIGVQFINPVDVYLTTDRALKYGFLFVALTFIVFFLYEMLKQLKIHPVQYGLVGIALALFFLLLLSLSEHIAFTSAYLIAATSCVGLLTYYVAHILGGLWRAAGFGLLLATIYGTLYTLLQLEDFALLTGSALLFIALGAVMIITRKFDWHHLSPEHSKSYPPRSQTSPPLTKPKRAEI